MTVDEWKRELTERCDQYEALLRDLRSHIEDGENCTDLTDHDTDEMVALIIVKMKKLEALGEELSK